LTPIKCTHPYDPLKVITFISYLIVLLLRNMYEHRQRRAVAKKRKSAVNVDSENGGNKRPMNICGEVKAPPQEQAPEPTDDEVLPLKIHSPLEKSGSLREVLTIGSKTITRSPHRERSHAMMWRRKRTILDFGPFSM
jgi:hypothetical protein